jgi:hypothetical protein
MPEDQLFEKNKFAAFGSEMKPEAESEPRFRDGMYLGKVRKAVKLSSADR